MLSPWPQQRRNARYGSSPRPPSVIRLVLFLAVVIFVIYRLLRIASGG